MARKRMISAAIKYTMIERYISHCFYCGILIDIPKRIDGTPFLAYGHGKSPFHIDHVIPESKGGKTVLANLVLSCAKCNMQKGNKWHGNE